MLYSAQREVWGFSMPLSKPITMGNKSSMTPIKCSSCAIRKLCLPVTLAESEVEHLESIIKKGSTLKKGTYLFRDGDEFQHIYAIRSGSFINSTISDEGDEQITGFFLPGEIIGMDSIHSGVHPTSAKTLETSSVCAIPFNRLKDLARDIPTLQSQLFKIMSNEIHDEHNLMLLLGKKSAEERLASFMVNLSQRFKVRGLSETSFRLPMTRSQIGNYLGLAVETVSRLLSKYHQQQILSVQDKEIKVLNKEQLSEMAGTNCHHF